MMKTKTTRRSVDEIAQQLIELVTSKGPMPADALAKALNSSVARVVDVIYRTSALQPIGIEATRPGKRRRQCYGLSDGSPIKPPRPQAKRFGDFPPPAAPGATSFACSRLVRVVELGECIEAYVDASARYSTTSPCSQCRTGAVHRARFAEGAL